MALWCDVFAPGKQTCLCEGLLRNEEAWLSRMCVCARVCVSSFLSLSSLSLSLVLPFSLSCLDSYSLFHANILQRSSSLLLCTSYCVFGLAPCTFSLWKIKKIKKENLRRKKSLYNTTKKESWEFVQGQTAKKNLRGSPSHVQRPIFLFLPISQNFWCPHKLTHA